MAKKKQPSLFEQEEAELGSQQAASSPSSLPTQSGEPNSAQASNSGATPASDIPFDLDDEPATGQTTTNVRKATSAKTSARPTAPISTQPVETLAGPVDHENLTGKTVFVIDAYALIYQVFHAYGTVEMSSPSGEPVAAVHGFLRDILDVLEKYRPDYLFCAFDRSGDTFRNELYPEYKANREEMPVDLRSQIDKIRRLVTTLAVPVVDCENYEADDVMATLAKVVAERNGLCYLLTSDKDCRQLINPKVKLYNMRKQQVYDENSLLEDWGIRPDQVVDFQSLVGDAVDNVPGVPLIGPKIAAELLNAYKTLEGVYENIDKVTQKKRKENLVNAKADAFLSKQLVRLVDDVPIQIDWETGHTSHFNVREAAEVAKEFGFRALTERLLQLQFSGRPTHYVAAEPPKEKFEPAYLTIKSLDELRDLVEKLATQDRFVLDTETTSTSARSAELVGISISFDRDTGYYIPVRAPAGEIQLSLQETLELLRPVFTNVTIEKIGQNLKYDLIVLRNHGLDIGGTLFDTMVADYLIDPGQRNHSVDDLAERYLQHVTIKITELIGTGKNQKRMDEVPIELITNYAAEDAVVPFRLTEILRPLLAQQKLDGLFTNLEMPLIRVLAEMEFNGIRVDTSVLSDLNEVLVKRIADHEKAIYELAGGEFNMDSPKQLAHILFEKLNLPIKKKTKTGPSTDVEVLNDLAELHELPARMIEYRQDSKLKNTYVDTLPELVNPKTGRVHTSFMQDVAATGRLSSKDPNLQNIPVRTELGRMIRRAFVPGHENWVLLCADYSQIELRVLAHFCEDEVLLDAFVNNQDIHARVAAEVAGVPISEVTSEMRRKAKAINFGIIYGQSPFGLAKALSIPKEEAADFIDRYFKRYPKVDAFMEKVLDDAAKTRQVSTIAGRRRLVDGVRTKAKRGDSRIRSMPERIAVNTVVQGSAADLIKMAMIRVYEQLASKNLKSKLLLQIHDELVFEAPPEEVTELRALVIEAMTSVLKLSVPLKVDVKTGKNWGECEAT